MNDEQARAVAEALGGEPWQSGGAIWLVVIHRPDGKAVAISAESVCEYASDEALETGLPTSSIILA